MSDAYSCSGFASWYGIWDFAMKREFNSLQELLWNNYKHLESLYCKGVQHNQRPGSGPNWFHFFMFPKEE
jgi:hypothetical protein